MEAGLVHLLESAGSSAGCPWILDLMARQLERPAPPQGAEPGGSTISLTPSPGCLQAGLFRLLCQSPPAVLPGSPG